MGRVRPPLGRRPKLIPKLTGTTSQRGTMLCTSDSVQNCVRRLMHQQLVPNMHAFHYPLKRVSCNKIA